MVVPPLAQHEVAVEEQVRSTQARVGVFLAAVVHVDPALGHQAARLTFRFHEPGVDQGVDQREPGTVEGAPPSGRGRGLGAHLEQRLLVEGRQLPRVQRQSRRLGPPGFLGPVDEGAHLTGQRTLRGTAFGMLGGLAVEVSGWCRGRGT